MYVDSTHTTHSHNSNTRLQLNAATHLTVFHHIALTCNLHPARTAISVLEQMIAQLKRMQLQTAQFLSDTSAADRHLQQEIKVMTAQL